YADQIKTYVATLRDEKSLVIIPQEQRSRELNGIGTIALNAIDSKGTVTSQKVTIESTFPPVAGSSLEDHFERAATTNIVEQILRPKIIALTMASVRPNFELDEHATADAQNRAADVLAQNEASVEYRKN